MQFAILFMCIAIVICLQYHHDEIKYDFTWVRILMKKNLSRYICVFVKFVFVFTINYLTVFILVPKVILIFLIKKNHNFLDFN